MAQKMTIRYDPVGDILYIDLVEPYAEQISDMLSDTVVARLNRESGRVENLEVLFFAQTQREEGILSLPIEAAFTVIEAAVTTREPARAS